MDDRLPDKRSLRSRLRAERAAHVAALDPATRALLFLRPPAAVAALAKPHAVVGLYHAGPAEAPTHRYARWLYEAGHPVSLPWFAARGEPMRFRRWLDPFNDDGLVAGPYGALQPAEDAPEEVPSLLFVPLLGFTADGRRLGQGGGHYDRWLAEHPQALAVGLAWDSQRLDALPCEPHDRALGAIVTPTRLYGPFEVRP